MNDWEIEKIVSQLTLEEKASLSSGKDFWQSQEIARLNIPSVYFADGPHGLRKQEAEADHLGLNESVKSTCFPTAVTLASTWNLPLIERVGEALGKEARALNVGVLLGPGVNVKRSPLCGRNFEYFSEDCYLSGKCGSSLVRGIQNYAPAACVKHYACNNQETARMYVDAIVDERTLREIYLTPFEMTVKEGGARTVMSAYNKVNGVYANENPHLMVEILRDEWGFDGVVVTDWGGCNSRVEGAKCYNEIEMPTTGGESNAELVAAAQSGELSESVLDKNCTRLLKLAFSAQEQLKGRHTYDKRAHHRLAREAAAEGAVLLKNDGALPLKRGERVCVIGDFAQFPREQGGGSSHVNPTRLESVLDCLEGEKYCKFTGFERGFHRYGRRSKRLIKRAVKLLDSAEKAIVFLGLDDVTESEGMDRADLRLPQNQIELLCALKKANKPLVVVLSCGSPVETDWDVNANALLLCYLTGQAGGSTILDCLTGRVNPSGKLAETFPVKLSDTPAYRYYCKHELTAEYREALFVGYRHYDGAGLPVKYPFGFGLSYTQFDYSNLTVTNGGVEFSLKNAGRYAGAEVVQLYVGAKNSRIFRAKRELKGFQKVFLNVGEEVRVHIPFDEYTFRFYNVKNNRWEVEDCEYELSVASSSRDIRLVANYRPANGMKADTDYDREILEPYYLGRADSVRKDTFEALLGRKVPSGEIPFDEKNRITVGYNTPIHLLKYARGWTGRAFAGSISFTERWLRRLGKRKMANVLRIGPYDMPVRGLSRLTGGAFTMRQLDGLIAMFNGSFFHGLKMVIKGRRGNG